MKYYLITINPNSDTPYAGNLDGAIAAAQALANERGQSVAIYAKELDNVTFYKGSVQPRPRPVLTANGFQYGHH